MAEITTRTVGEGGDELELTIEEQLAMEASRIDAQARDEYVGTETEDDVLRMLEETDKPEFVRATFFTPEPVILIQGVFTAGEIELPLTVDEARALSNTLDEAVGEATT